MDGRAHDRIRAANRRNGRRDSTERACRACSSSGQFVHTERIAPLIKDFALNERHADFRVDAERMSVPDRHVAVLAHFQTARPFVDAQLNGGVDGDKSQRLVFIQAAVLHAVRGFDVQPIRALLLSELTDVTMPAR